jgi:hypothetical protein
MGAISLEFLVKQKNNKKKKKSIYFFIFFVSVWQAECMQKSEKISSLERERDQLKRELVVFKQEMFSNQGTFAGKKKNKITVYNYF